MMTTPRLLRCEFDVLVSMAYWRVSLGSGCSVLMMVNDVDEHLYGVWGMME